MKTKDNATPAPSAGAQLAAGPVVGNPTNSYLFKQLCAKHGIELGKDTIAEALAKIAAPAPSASPVALTEGQREAILEVMDLARDEGLPGTAETLQSILAASPSAPAPAAQAGEREAFEAFIRSRGKEHMLGRAAGHEDRYADVAMEGWWFVWQAARRSLCPVPDDWRTLLKDLADELENEIMARYQGYPPNDRRFVRDMLTVKEAREFLEAHKEKL